MENKNIYCSECQESTEHELEDKVFSEKKLCYIEIWTCTCCGEYSHFID